MRTSLAWRNWRERNIVHGRAIAQLIVLVCIAAGCLVLAVRQTQGANDESLGAAPSIGIICDRDEARGAGSLPAPIDDNACAALPIWKTITLGIHDSADSLRQAVRRHAGRLAGEALDGPDFGISKVKTDVDLVVLSAAELGFEAESEPLAEIYAQAARIGLELCPAEVAPQLRLQYLDQPLGEFLHVAMKPLATEGGDFVNLSLANGGAGLLLIGGDGSPGLMVPSTLRFVFVRPR
jgi:hypothetical protein